ncbi:MAG: hypothetical protein B7Z11_05445 [Acidovorax sp. 32-64-7]|nr:MAG: hypothetical protein B7Z11_05445 [Acidovorax sp. 32-64-7]
MMSMAVAERLAPRPEAAAETSLAARLRRETRDLHDRIEANHRFARLMAPDLTRGEYRGLVARLRLPTCAADAAPAHGIAPG